MSRDHEGREPVRTIGARALGHTRLAALAAAGLVSVAALPEAEAQVKTFYLDRIQVAGAPDDGVSVWRPEMSEKVRIFGQLGFGFALNPFRVENHVDGERQRNDAGARIGTPIEGAFSGYVHAGVDFLKRFQFQVSLPVTLYQAGKGTANAALPYASDTTSVSSTVANDMRFELRGVPFFTRDRFFKTGLNAALWAPTGDKLSYGGDGSTSGGLGLAAEIDAKKAFITLNAFFHFRPYAAINAFAVQDEFRWALGGYVPVRDGLLRLGLNIFGNTSLNGNQNNASQTKRNFARDANTPLEWQLEGRLAPDEKKRSHITLAGGTRLTPGYSPDFRVMLLAGYFFTIGDTDPKSPEKKLPVQQPGAADTDKDGIPDDIDLCPTVPEDKKPPNTDDGCPGIDDRDGDGIPDSKDKCPDVPEDFDKIDDADGCPEDDADQDKIPDAQDACPKEPGEPSPDQTKNGCPQFIRRISGSSEIQILKQVQFQTGSAKILPNSYPILDEVVRLLKVNLDITMLSVEGHTDNRGSDALNEKLSADRAKSCVDYLVSKGIEASRLTSSGFGPRKPIDDNNTAAGRQKNRRTEFHIKNKLGGTDAPGEPAPPPPKPGDGGATLPD